MATRAKHCCSSSSRYFQLASTRTPVITQQGGASHPDPSLLWRGIARHPDPSSLRWRGGACRLAPQSKCTLTFYISIL